MKSANVYLCCDKNVRGAGLGDKLPEMENKCFKYFIFHPHFSLHVSKYNIQRKRTAFTLLSD